MLVSRTFRVPTVGRQNPAAGVWPCSSSPAGNHKIVFASFSAAPGTPMEAKSASMDGLSGKGTGWFCAHSRSSHQAQRRPPLVSIAGQAPQSSQNNGPECAFIRLSLRLDHKSGLLINSQVVKALGADYRVPILFRNYDSPKVLRHMISIWFRVAADNAAPAEADH